MHLRGVAIAVILSAAIASAGPAAAQRLSFERSFNVSAAQSLDVLTQRGKIDVTAGDPGRVVVRGTVTVRVAFDVPANALELAQRVAARPPIEQSGDGLRLRPPSDFDEQRAVTVAYEVRVPREWRVRAASDSGAISIGDISGTVEAKTQSAAISLARLGGRTEVATGSGAVAVDTCHDALRVTTASSGIMLRGLFGDLYVRTESGNVDARFTGPGDVDVRTGSSAITLDGISGALASETRSGRTIVTGTPRGPWRVSTGSSSIEVSLASDGGLALEAESGSGSVRAEGLSVKGEVANRRVAGNIGSGGPLVRLTSRSGSIRIKGR